MLEFLQKYEHLYSKRKDCPFLHKETIMYLLSSIRFRFFSETLLKLVAPHMLKVTSCKIFNNISL